jgi:hypothetical protein
MIGEATNTFRPADTIFVSVATEGTGTATVATRLTFEDGQVANESQQSITPSGPARTEFHLSKPDGWPAGKYRLVVLVNGMEAGSRDIEVAPR